MRIIALGAALLGGVALVAHLFVDADALTWAGLLLVGLAAAVAGARLARAWWLTLVTGSGSVALGWAVLEAARESAPDRDVEAVVGGLATLCVAVAVLRPPRAPDPDQGDVAHRGNHRS